jgi:DNA transformation protein and related proteins
MHTLRGLGPRSRAMLAAVGVTQARQVREADAVALYLRVRAVWPQASLNLLYALVAALLLRLDALGQAPR